MTPIAARLGASIERAEADLAKRKTPADLGAYDYYLQGRAKRLTSVKQQILEARELFRKTVELDPGFALSADHRPEDLARGVRHAQQ